MKAGTPRAGARARPSRGEPRDRINRLLVVVNEGERGVIQARAKEAGLSVSAYLRAAGLGRPPSATPAVDHEQILALSKTNADLGRLGGLLKWWLADWPGRGAPEPDVRKLLNEIGDTRSRLAEIADMIPIRETRRRR